jgi:DNA-binding CsgD family transcriptional regulator
VARLVAEGLSNPDIASRLFISRATVKTHLARVFTKLDIINRAQLAALATAEDTFGRG